MCVCKILGGCAMLYEINIVGLGSRGFVDFLDSDILEIGREMWSAISIDSTDRGFYLSCSDGDDVELIRI